MAKIASPHSILLIFCKIFFSTYSSPKCFTTNVYGSVLDAIIFFTPISLPFANRTPMALPFLTIIFLTDELVIISPPYD